MYAYINFRPGGRHHCEPNHFPTVELCNFSVGLASLVPILLSPQTCLFKLSYLLLFCPATFLFSVYVLGTYIEFDYSVTRIRCPDDVFFLLSNFTLGI